MARMILWLVIGFIVWKMIRLASSMSRRPKDLNTPKPPFANIEDAEFEDMTKQSSDSSSPQKDH